MEIEQKSQHMLGSSNSMKKDSDKSDKLGTLKKNDSISSSKSVHK